LSIAVLLVLGACSGPGDATNLFPEVEGEDAEVAGGTEELTVDSGAPEVAPEEVFDFSIPDLGTPDELVADAVDDVGLETFDPCMDLPLAFGCTCEDDDDCQDGICVQGLTGKVCTSPCTTECPEGFACSLLAGTCPDCQYVCMPLFVNLCRPCMTNNDCKSGDAATGDLCVVFGDDGAFCGAACSGVVTCPSDYSCKSVDVVGGVTSYQCVPDSWECDCSELAVLGEAATSCTVENEHGACQGVRICTEDGLTDCDAQVPAAEVCNSVDDNCNGAVDEDLGGGECAIENEFGSCAGTEICVGGVTICDGSDPVPEMCDGMDNNCDGATDENSLDTDQDGAANCIDEDDDNDLVDDQLDNCPLVYNADQEDSDYDLAGDECDPDDDNDQSPDDEDCAPTDKDSYPGALEVCDGKDNDCNLWVDEDTCEDNNACTDDICDPVEGCKYTPNTNGCDDGNPCTAGDACAEGECVSGPDVCPCQEDSDCEGLGFVGGCMGELFCDTSVAPTVCKIDPAGATPCPPSNDPCTANACNPATGSCDVSNQPDGMACEDGNVCTAGDQCVGGACVEGDNLCECDVDEDCAPMEDGDFCNGTLYCDKFGTFAVCKLDLNSIVECPASKEPCKENLCLPETGDCELADLADTTPCEDGSVCTVNSICVDGECAAGNVVQCDDGNPCTADECDADVGCVATILNDVPCNDGDFCSAGDSCQQGVCTGGDDVTCNDGNPCTSDSCNPASGCVYSPVAGECDDDNECTENDICKNGSCTGLTILECDDSNSCTYDTCDPDSGCVHTPQDLPCSDGDQCTVIDSCVQGECVGVGEPDCEDGNLCTDDSCTPGEGCVNAPNTLPCDDGSECTTNDTCGAGACVGGPAPDCDDNDVCTDDSCDPDVGCGNVVNTDFNTDELNCGECGNICPEFTVCLGGDCLLVAGQPCGGDGECLSNYCRLDWDDDGMFCAQDAVSCVYALQGLSASQVSPGGKMCGASTAHRTCNSGVWTPAETCAAANCDVTVFYPAQECVDGFGCTPDPQSEEECGDYACDANGCKESCANNNDCAPGHLCQNGECSGGPINQPGSILPGSEFYGEAIAGWVQCAGWTNTNSWDIVTTNWIHSCARNSGQMRFRLYSDNGDVVLDDTFPHWTQTEMSNNLPGCNNSGYGTCGKSGSGKGLLIYKPDNGNGGCHGDDNSSGAVRIANGIQGDNTMGDNYVFLGGKRHDGGFRNHNNADQPNSEIRWRNGQLWDGCNHDDRATSYSIAVYVTN